jgi:hypothetical protein
MSREERLQPALPMGLKRPGHDQGGPEWSPAQEADKTRQRITLKAASPLQGAVDQHDESGLALFRAVDEPGLF